MNISQRLRTCAKHTALDAVIELLNEAADEIDALQARANGLATQPAEVTDSMIREAFLANGFTIKDGHSDLKPYVYAAARAILALCPQPAEKLVPMPHRHYSEALADDLIASGDVESVIASHSGKEAP